MNIFDKGDFKRITHPFKQSGLSTLRDLTKFQEEFSELAGGDTDTTINAIRDSLVASYLNFDLLNTSKHGFDAKASNEDRFLEIKQCSIVSKTWGGTWNDTNEEKANAFSDRRLFTAVAVWKGAGDLQFIVYGQDERLGHYLLEKVQNRKQGSRSTQSVSLSKLLDWDFNVIVPPNMEKSKVKEMLILSNTKIARKLEERSLLSIGEVTGR